MNYFSACINGDANALRTVLSENPNFVLDSIIEQEATPLNVAITTITQNKGSPELIKVCQYFPSTSYLRSSCSIITSKLTGKREEPLTC